MAEYFGVDFEAQATPFGGWRESVVTSSGAGATYFLHLWITETSISMMNRIGLFATSPLIAALVLRTGCEGFGGGDEYRPYVTEIRRVEVEPNPIATGDTAIFTCVVADSADTSLSFVWFLGEELDTTRTNQTSWVAPSEPETYSYKIRVIRPGDANVHFTQERFSVTVVE